MLMYVNSPLTSHRWQHVFLRVVGVFGDREVSTGEISGLGGGRGLGGQKTENVKGENLGDVVFS